MRNVQNRRSGKYVVVLAAALALFFAAGCSKKSGQPAAQQSSATNAQTVATTSANVPQQPLPAQGSGYAHVTYRPNVHVMEEDEGRRAIIGVSTYENALLFDSSNSTARALHAGDVLMIKNLIVRKVLAAEQTPDGVIVLTEQAALTDLVQDGDIHIQMPVHFGAQQAEAPQPKPFWSFDGLFVEPAYAQSPENAMAQKAQDQGTKDFYGNVFKGVQKVLVDDWDTTYQATPGEGKTDLNITLKKELGGFVALITGQGYISNFGFESDIGIQQSTVQKMETAFKNLNGVMNFQWSVATNSAGVRADESRIKLPGAVDVPLAPLTGGIPFNLEVSAAILIHPAITGGSEYTKGQFRITYDGYQHFRVKPGNVDADGNLTGDIALGDHADLSPSAPLGMVVAFCAPRIELSIGLNKIGKLDATKAADIVDKIADQVAKRLLSPDKYQDFQQNGIHLGKLLKQTLSTDAAAYFQTIGTSASSYSGSASISPCSRYDLTFVAQVGAGAELAGTSLGKLNKDILKKTQTKVDPPGMALCENIGKS